MAFSPASLVLTLLAILAVVAHGYTYCDNPVPIAFPANSTFKLAFTAVVVRHGDRSPVNVLPVEESTYNCNTTDYFTTSSPSMNAKTHYQKNIYIDEASPYSAKLWKGNCVVGQLTKKGADQHYEMGKALRSIYVDNYKLVSPTYNPEEIYVRSTDVWRTQQSAAANFLGFYPNEREAIVMHIKPHEVEDMVLNTAACPKIGAMIAAQRLSSTWKARYASTTLSTVLSKMSTITRAPNNWFMTIDHFFDNFQCRTCTKIPLPCKNNICVTQADTNVIFQEGDWEYAFLHNGDISRLGMSSFLTTLQAAVRDVLSGADTRRYRFYSGHDDTMQSLKSAFGVEDGFWPPYASHWRLEVWKDQKSQSYARVIYNNKVWKLPECNLQEFCPLNTFNNILNQIIQPSSNC